MLAPDRTGQTQGMPRRPDQERVTARHQHRDWRRSTQDRRSNTHRSRAGKPWGKQDDRRRPTRANVGKAQIPYRTSEPVAANAANSAYNAFAPQGRPRTVPMDSRTVPETTTPAVHAEGWRGSGCALASCAPARPASRRLSANRPGDRGRRAAALRMTGLRRYAARRLTRPPTGRRRGHPSGARTRPASATSRTRGSAGAAHTRSTGGPRGPT